jgi:hypothetical protein
MRRRVSTARLLSAGIGLAPPPSHAYIRAIRSPFSSSDAMAQLFLYISVFAVIVAIVAAVCFWFVRQEENEARRRGGSGGRRVERVD